MPQGSVSPLPVLLALLGYAMAGLHLWPSLHVALSNASVFIDYSTERNDTVECNTTLSLVDTETNTTVLTRNLPSNQSEGRVEFNCSCFLYAGKFRFRLEQTRYAIVHNTNGSDMGSTEVATLWWSPELKVEWPTIHIAVERSSNQSGSFQVGISTNEHFQSCSSGFGSALYLEVSYLEFNQIGRNSIDKVRARTRLPIKALHSQTMELACAFPFTERDFVTVALRSTHTAQDVKTSGPLYLSRIFSYKLLVNNPQAYRTGCEGTVSVRLITPPCAHINGKVRLYRDGPPGGRGASGSPGGAGAGLDGPDDPSSPLLAFKWLTHGENETEFNCSVFEPGRNKYCFRFVLNFSRSPSPAQTCLVVHRSAETWGLWQAWSMCSVSCGEGVRERVRECLLPSGGGGLQCTGMMKEQSLCSLDDCAVLAPPTPSNPPTPAGVSLLGGNLVVMAGISLCLAVILATVLVTVWRKLCRAPPCSSVRRASMHSPGGRKLSDEASICGHSLQRPSLSESQGQGALGLGLAQAGSSPLGGQALPQPVVLPLAQDPDRLSPSGQKVLPPIFGYRLAQHQLKEMKKKGLKEATQVYHVSQSPVHDTLLETTATPTAASTPTPAGLTSPGLTPSPVALDLQEEANLSGFRIAVPFPEAWAPPRSCHTLPDRLSPRVELVLGAPAAGYASGGSAKRRDRTADWVEMVERSSLGGLRGGGAGGAPYQRNPNFRRTLSFHDTKPQPPPLASSRPYRERSMSQVAPRTVPEGSCKTRGAWENQAYPPYHSYPIPEQGPADWARSPARAPGDNRRRPWLETSGPTLTSDTKHTGTNTSAATSMTELAGKAEVRGGMGWLRGGGRGGGGGTSGIGGPGTRGDGAHLGVERAEQKWSRRGPSPIQRNILARKLKEAQSCSPASGPRGRQRSSTFSASASEQRKSRCRSLPLSGDYSSSGSPYGLSEEEQRMLDLDLAYLGEVEYSPGHT
ncbi:thrombospondin type-1 domain-containing protein 1 [Osmerus eperlanus]|uniref:thrombospondin type-1 domain-containing protein 1 n=1 Tax=Osmerus eperlanus TaxID=29151 RepID=UPI002E1435AB